MAKMIWRHHPLNGVGTQRVLQFEHDGATLSLALGWGSYSDGDAGTENATMEVAMWKAHEGLLDLGDGDTVAGHKPVALLAPLLAALFGPGSADARLDAMRCVLVGRSPRLGE
jgi:hypothetical protein